VGYSTPRVVPREQDLRQAADVLNAGERVAMLVGAGCMRAGDEAPGCTGSIGLLGTEASWELMSGCDTLLMVGSSFPYSEFLPTEGQARGVQIDLKARMHQERWLPPAIASGRVVRRIKWGRDPPSWRARSRARSARMNLAELNPNRGLHQKAD